MSDTTITPVDNTSIKEPGETLYYEANKRFPQNAEITGICNSNGNNSNTYAFILLKYNINNSNNKTEIMI